MKKFLSIIIATLCVLLTACSDKGSKVINVAFQSEENGRWGMMTTTGKVIFEDEFERTPSASVNGYFTVKNGNEMWEIYSAEEKPKQVGGEYLYAGPFVDGVAPVVEKDKPVTLINTEGKVVTTLDKLSGKTVKRVQTVFSYGRAIFEIEEEELYGMVNTDGRVLIEPEYPGLFLDGGLVLGITKKGHEKMVENDDDFPEEIIVFDLNGKEQSRIKTKKNDITFIAGCSEGILKVQVGKGSSRKVGLMDKKGEWIVKPVTKVKDIGDVVNKKFVYYDGERYGLMNYNGEILIRAKYNSLSFVTEKVLAAVEYKNGDSEVSLINLEGDEVCNDTWELLVNLGDGNILARENSNSWIIINAKGKTVSDKTLDIYDFNLGYSDNGTWITSDYLDIAAMLSKLSIAKDGMLGITLHSGAEASLNALYADSETKLKPENFAYSSHKTNRKDLGTTTATVEVYFDSNLAEGVLGTKQGTDWYGNPYTYETTVGYKWSAAKPQMICAEIHSGGKMRDKESDVYQFLAAQVSNFGKVTKQGKKFIVVSLGKNEVLLAADLGSSGVAIGYIGAPAEYFDGLDDDIIRSGSSFESFATVPAPAEEAVEVVVEDWVCDSIAY